MPNIQCTSNWNYQGPTCNGSMFFEFVSPEEIVNIINDLDPTKAAGSDMIPAKIVKELKDVLVDPLTHLVNKIIEDASYPDSLKYAIIKPLHKKGDKHSISNYRPIALLPIINKIVEKVIINRMQEFLTTNGINDKEQYGFKKQIGTNDAILKLSNQLSIFLDRGECVIIIFMDLTSAFDTLKREILIDKLTHLGFRGHVSSLIESYFDKRTQAVKVGEATSDAVINDIGVAQGSCKGPFLFNINLIDSPIIASQRIKYADDNIIFRNCKKESIELTISEMINDVILMSKHFEASGLKLNYSKTKFMIVSNSKLTDIPNVITIDDEIAIDRMATYKFLGVHLDEQFTLKEQFNQLHNKLTQTVRVLTIIKHHLPQTLLLQFFHAHFMSNLHYCSFLYAKLNCEDIKKIQILQSRCIKQIYGLDTRFSTAELFKSVISNTLPVIGVIYSSLLTNIHKSLMLERDELIKFETSNSNRRSSGSLIPSRFTRKHRLGTDISHLGVKLYNQLPNELKNLKSLEKFKFNLKVYLLSKIDLLLSPDQHTLRKIA